uniref:Uncharacterized protein n=1 Tax=Timema bartmani TaxID=61472 RepID=A0A7R9F5F6_9NEOP|nr:unnamed protein product [Timema bartmani]
MDNTSKSIDNISEQGISKENIEMAQNTDVNMGPQETGKDVNMGPQETGKDVNMGPQETGKDVNMGPQETGKDVNMGPQETEKDVNTGPQETEKAEYPGDTNANKSHQEENMEGSTDVQLDLNGSTEDDCKNIHSDGRAPEAEPCLAVGHNFVIEESDEEQGALNNDLSQKSTQPAESVFDAGDSIRACVVDVDEENGKKPVPFSEVDMFESQCDSPSSQEVIPSSQEQVCEQSVSRSSGDNKRKFEDPEESQTSKHQRTQPLESLDKYSEFSPQELDSTKSTVAVEKENTLIEDDTRSLEKIIGKVSDKRNVRQSVEVVYMSVSPFSSSRANQRDALTELADDSQEDFHLYLSSTPSTPNKSVGDVQVSTSLSNCNHSPLTNGVETVRKRERDGRERASDSESQVTGEQNKKRIKLVDLEKEELIKETHDILPFEMHLKKMKSPHHSTPLAKRAETTNPSESSIDGHTPEVLSQDISKPGQQTVQTKSPYKFRTLILSDWEVDRETREVTQEIIQVKLVDNSKRLSDVSSSTMTDNFKSTSSGSVTSTGMFPLKPPVRVSTSSSSSLGSSASAMAQDRHKMLDAAIFSVPATTKSLFSDNSFRKTNHKSVTETRITLLNYHMIQSLMDTLSSPEGTSLVNTTTDIISLQSADDTATNVDSIDNPVTLPNDTELVNTPKSKKKLLARGGKKMATRTKPSTAAKKENGRSPSEEKRRNECTQECRVSRTRRTKTPTVSEGRKLSREVVRAKKQVLEGVTPSGEGTATPHSREGTPKRLLRGIQPSTPERLEIPPTKSQIVKGIVSTTTTTKCCSNVVLAPSHT